MTFWRRLRPKSENRSAIKLLGRLETLEYITANPVSLARFGDGEVGYLFQRNAVPFQEYDARLAEKLRAVLAESKERILVAYNNSFLKHDEWPLVLKYPRGEKQPYRFESVFSPNDVGFLERSKQRVMYEDNFTRLEPLFGRDILGDATLFFLGFYYEEYKRGQLGRVLDLYRQLFAGRRILFVCPRQPILGASFFDLVEQGVVRSPASVDFIEVPNENAFRGYDELLGAIMEHRSGIDRVMLQLGPTATALAHDLMRDGGLVSYDVGSLNTSMQLAWELDRVSF